MKFVAKRIEGLVRRGQRGPLSWTDVDLSDPDLWGASCFVDFRHRWCLFALAGVREFEFPAVYPPVPKPRSSRISPRLSAPLPPRAVVDRGFIPVRAKLLEVAAFLDRVERHEAAGDFRCVALREAAALLGDGQPERARRILEKLSDPTTKPDRVSSGKAALGAWRPPAK